MSRYLDVTTPEGLQVFINLTTMPDTHVREVDGKYKGYLQARFDWRSDWLDSRLRKRYVAPFVLPYPPVIVGWIVAIETLQAMLKRGVDPQDLQFGEIKEQAQKALDEVKEAADAENGLFDLPLRASQPGPGGVSGATQGGPFCYSETSPYVQRDIQAETGYAEDRQHRGTSGGR